MHFVPLWQYLCFCKPAEVTRYTQTVIILVSDVCEVADTVKGGIV